MIGLKKQPVQQWNQMWLHVCGLRVLTAEPRDSAVVVFIKQAISWSATITRSCGCDIRLQSYVTSQEGNADSLLR